MSTCSNGGCRRPASVLITTGVRSVDERPACEPCAEALRSLFPRQRAMPDVPTWVRRMDRNAWVRGRAA